MEKVINVTVREKIATADMTVYVCGNSDFVIAFDFDQEWDEYDVKTARFKHNGKDTDVVFSGNTCKVPIISNTYGIEVGVYAGNLCTTTPAYVAATKSILCGGGVPADPPNDVYNQIMGILNGMSEGVAEIYCGDGEMPDGYKLQIIPNKVHTGKTVDISHIIHSPIVGSVEGNVVTLSGDLPKGVYEIRYLLADGTTADIGTVEVT